MKKLNKASRNVSLNVVEAFKEDKYACHNECSMYKYECQSDNPDVLSSNFNALTRSCTVD